MALKLYNTRTKQKELFEPIDRQNVRMYVCGPTVYDYAHIGNARPVIVFDVLFRLLRHLYGENHVTYVRNITDVDDKINARAAQTYPDLPPLDGIAKLTAETTAQFHADVAALGCLPPTIEPRATEYVHNPAAASDMIRIVQRLIERGHAYEAEGHVLFAVATDPNYGKLARRSLDEMQAGARVEVAPYKRDAMDFVLWKPSAPTEPGWASPWGYGRPGWHLECSAMSAALLGETFDIHGGGIDLVFPHHENEVAQSTCAHGTDIMANIWMHNGFLQVEGEKMSKSDGNFVTIRELLAESSGYEIRLLMLTTHYKQPIDWTHEGLRKSVKQWTELINTVRDFQPSSKPPTQFIEALEDDLNTPLAISVLYELKASALAGSKDAARDLRAALQLIGLIPEWIWTDAFPDYVSITETAEAFFESLIVRGVGDGLPRQMVVNFQEALARHGKSLPNSVLSVAYVMGPSITIRDIRDGRLSPITLMHKLTQRLSARAVKNFAEADRIRDELAAMGIALKDAKDPVTGEIVTTWEIAR